MPKIIAINMADWGSTGEMAVNILLAAKKKGFDVCLACVNPTRTDINCFNITPNKFLRNVSHFYSRVFDADGFCSKASTKRLIKFLQKEDPDIIHLHNLHGYYVNIEQLFDFLISKDKKIVWTFHDCWPFTGKCPHYIFKNCDKWKNSCGKCPNKGEYPRSVFLDQTKKHLLKKKKIFEKSNNLTIVCPSDWLKSQVMESVAKKINVLVINNGINQLYFDLPFAKKDSSKSYNVFSMAYPWTPYKRLDVILNAAKRFEEHSDIKFVVAGIEKPYPQQKNVIFLPKQDIKQIISYLDHSFVFLNPSENETFGLTNVEAQARGIPSIIAKGSGGAEETIIDKKTGFAVDISNIDEVVGALEQVFHSDKTSTFNECRRNADKFSCEAMTSKYIDLYYEIITKK